MGTYPVKLVAELHGGGSVPIASSFAPRRISERQAQELNDWVASDSGPARYDDPRRGYFTDTMPQWVARFPWYKAAGTIAGVALVYDVALLVQSADPSIGPSVVAAAAGAVAAFGRLARRLPGDEGGDGDRVM